MKTTREKVERHAGIACLLVFIQVNKYVLFKMISLFSILVIGTLKQKYVLARKLLNNPLGVSKSNFLENIKQDCL